MDISKNVPAGKYSFTIPLREEKILQKRSNYLKSF
jgi:hypothetical protein